MYEAFFGLQRRPFATVAHAEQYFPAGAIETARQTLVRCIQRSEGPAVIVGPSGTGKTLLCQVLAEHFRSTMRVAILSRGRLNARRALLQAMLYELGQPYRGMDEGELRLALVDHVVNDAACPGGLLLLVDEAHALPLRLLDELRMFTNVAADGQPRVRLVLAGGAEIEERLATPKLDSFTQRIVARCYLETLSRSETEGFIHSQLQRVGGNSGAIFSPDACQAVHRATDGVPRLINQVCDHALLLACAAGRKQVGPDLVEEAWGDLQQLPTPWNGEPRAAKASNEAIIEFGGLEDADEPQTPALGPSTVPMLRVRQQDDDPPAQPIAPLEQIEGALSQLEDDFQPAGTIGPEVELVFQDPNNPFSESFEQEELVVERHPLPPPAVEVPPPPPPAIEPRRETAADSQERLAAVGAELAALSAALQATEASAEPVRMEPTRRELLESTLPLRPELATLATDDRDLIVVEDNYEEGPPAPPRAVTPVRQSEYRRLFATLRQG